MAPLLGLLVVNAVLAYRFAIDTAGEAYDRLLFASVKAIADRVTVANGEYSVDIPYVALELFESNVKERIFYRVSGPDGRTLTGYDDLPAPPSGAKPDRPLFYSADYRGERLYLAALRKPIYDGTAGGNVLVQVGETAESRQELSKRILYDSFARQGFLVLVAALVLVLGVRYVMRPLVRLRDQVAGRAATDISPVGMEGVQSEVRPLIEALNQHAGRIDRMISARVRFVADASHQIRTRLAVLRTQVDYGARVEDMRTIREVLAGMQDRIDETAHFFDQLLMLALAEAKAVPGQDLRPIDVTKIVHEVALDWVGEARKKEILLEFEGPGEAATAMGSEMLLRELFVNLVDNAIRYTQRGGCVMAKVHGENGEILVDVEDNGPGIPAEERPRVFERFYRESNARGEGSGLGLAIAGEICRYHGATIELADASGGDGLRVRVRLPRMPGDATATGAAGAPGATAS
jgi:two-component system sensor histidine kinase TctE